MRLAYFWRQTPTRPFPLRRTNWLYLERGLWLRQLRFPVVENLECLASHLRPCLKPSAKQLNVPSFPVRHWWLVTGLFNILKNFLNCRYYNNIKTSFVTQVQHWYNIWKILSIKNFVGSYWCNNSPAVTIVCWRTWKARSSSGLLHWFCRWHLSPAKFMKLVIVVGNN